MSGVHSWSSCGAGAALVLLLVAAPAGAADTTASQRAAAEALFQQATKLMDEKRYPEACEKLAGSQDLDPALGTMLYLADCYEHAGRTASAWALFREASDTAQRAGQLDRQRIALERATSLEARLSKLEVRVPAGRQVAGLELLVNGAAVPRASWNAQMPVDPGQVRIEARAPGKKNWALSLVLTEGPASRTVEVQQLADAPRAPSPRPAPGEAPAPSGSAQRTIGYIMGAAGVVAIAASSFFGYRAYALNKKSKGECRADAPNACTPEGVALREDSKTAGALSTIGTVSGGLLVASGITLVATAPSGGRERRETRASAAPTFGVTLRGAF